MAGSKVLRNGQYLFPNRYGFIPEDWVHVQHRCELLCTRFCVMFCHVMTIRTSCMSFYGACLEEVYGFYGACLEEVLWVFMELV